MMERDRDVRGGGVRCCLCGADLLVRGGPRKSRHQKDGNVYSVLQLSRCRTTRHVPCPSTTALPSGNVQRPAEAVL